MFMGVGQGGFGYLSLCAMVLAGKAAVWAVGVGCGYCAPRRAGLGDKGQRLRDVARVHRLVIRLPLDLGGCGGLGGFDGCGLGFGAVRHSGARWRARWRPSASALLGLFWTGFGMTLCGGGWLGSG